MYELCRILQKPRQFIDDAAVKWETKSKILVKHASEVESVSNSKLRLLLNSLSETGTNNIICYNSTLFSCRYQSSFYDCIDLFAARKSLQK